MFTRSITEDITSVKVMPEFTWALWDGGQYFKILTDYYIDLLPDILILTAIMKDDLNTPIKTIK